MRLMRSMLLVQVMLPVLWPHGKLWQPQGPWIALEDLGAEEAAQRTPSLRHRAKALTHCFPGIWLHQGIPSWHRQCVAFLGNSGIAGGQITHPTC